VARIVGTMGVRLRAVDTGLARDIKIVLTAAVKEATRDIGPGTTKGIEEDSRRTAATVRKVLGDAFDEVGRAASRVASAAFSGAKLLALGAAAGIAGGGVAGLTGGLIALVGAASQAGGAVGILPAALLAVKAVTATVQLGLVGVSDALKALGEGDAEAFNAALAKMSKNAQATILEVAKFKPAFDQLRLDVQTRLFEGLADVVQRLGNRYLPLARGLFKAMAVEINGVAREVAGVLSSERVLQQVNDAASNMVVGFNRARAAAVPLVGAISSIVAAGATQLPRLGEAVTVVSERFSAFVNGAADSGALESFFSRSLDVASQLGRILGNLGSALGNVFSAGNAAGAGLLNSLETITQALQDFTESAAGQEALSAFFSSIGSLVGQLLPLVTQLALAIGGGLAPIIQNLAAGVGPGLLAVFSQLNATFTNANPGISALGQAFGQILTAVAPLLPVIGQLIGQLAGALAGALTALLPTITAVVQKFVESPGLLAGIAGAFVAITQVIIPLVTSLAPLLPTITALITKMGGFKAILAAVTGPVGIAVGLFLALFTGSEQFRNAVLGLLGTVGSLVGQLVGALMPAVEAILGAIGPLIAQLGSALAPVITLAAQLLQGILTPAINALIPIVNALIPVIAQIANVMQIVIAATVPLINLLIAVLIPIIQNLMPIVTTVFNVIANVITNALQIVTGVIDVFVGVLTGNWSQAWNGVKEIVSGVLNTVKSIISGAFQIVSSVVSNTWNAIVSLARSAWAAIGDSVSSGVSSVVNFVTGLPGRVLSALGNFGSLLYNAGRDLLQGLLNGITSMIGAVVSKAADIGRSVLNGVKGALGISSPSKEMMKVATDTVDGLLIQMDKLSPDVKAAGDALASTMLSGVNAVNVPSLSGGGTTGGSGGDTTSAFYQQNNYQLPGTDARQFIDSVNRNGAYSLASQGTLRGVNRGPAQDGMHSSGFMTGVGGAA
jgi:phage-related protein